MCRFVIYKGTAPVQLSHLLTRPCHSIINQAFDSRLRLDHRRPINGDGFGVGEYSMTSSARYTALTSSLQAGMILCTTRNWVASRASSPPLRRFVSSKLEYYVVCQDGL